VETPSLLNQGATNQSRGNGAVNDVFLRHNTPNKIRRMSCHARSHDIWSKGGIVRVKSNPDPVPKLLAPEFCVRQPRFAASFMIPRCRSVTKVMEANDAILVQLALVHMEMRDTKARRRPGRGGSSRCHIRL